MVPTHTKLSAPRFPTTNAAIDGTDAHTREDAYCNWLFHYHSGEFEIIL